MTERTDRQAPPSTLDRISTRWATLRDPVQFVLRYAPAVRKYLDALLRDPHDADEVAQEFLLHVFQHGFPHASPDRGRFRDYLKRAVRNNAVSYLRRKQVRAHADVDRLPLADPDDPRQAAEEAFVAGWRRCVLDKAWRSLDCHQRQSPGNLFHTALRLAVDHPEEDSEALAARASAEAGRPVRADAFRKQLSRARRVFAELVLREVAQTLDAPTAEQVEEELTDLGLMRFLADFLPDDWRSRGLFPSDA